MTEAAGCDGVVIGAGVVGLAVARRLAARGASVVVLDRQAGPGRETSARNSGVIHSGLYYPPGSLMARLSVRGNHLLYEHCAKYGVRAVRRGKLIVAAVEAETAALDALQWQGTQNGVEGLRVVDRAELERTEPAVHGVAALFSPTTGVVDTAEYVRSLAYQASASGATLAYRSAVVEIVPAPGGYRLAVAAPDGTHTTIACRWIVNSAGLFCDQVAGLMGVDVDGAGYRLWYCKGVYFALAPSKGRLLRHLIYPVRLPGAPGLGIHVTVDVDGHARLGPDATYLPRNKIDYDVPAGRADEFLRSVRKLLPFVEAEDLRPDYAGIRPKITAPGAPQRDFVIAHEDARGLPGVVNLIGIESPGLTASLAIAEEVESTLARAGAL